MLKKSESRTRKGNQMDSKLFETLSACKLNLEGVILDSKNIDGICKIGDIDYDVIKMNDKLQPFKHGWCKYSLITFSKVINTNNKYVKVSSLLYLYHHTETNIVIARVVKYSPKTKKINIRYIIYQGNKEQLCSNLKELYLSMSRSYGYEGRPLTADDFKRNTNE